MDKVHEYILQNWKTTIKVDLNRIPFPYTTPCADDLFINFFYWDTYFTNLGLLRDGLAEQAKNNLLVMDFFLKKYGYIPNADHLLYRSQPPLFTRAVFDYYEYTKDASIIVTLKKSMLIEYSFFDKNRKTPIGLYSFSSEEPKEGLDWYYDEFARRLGGFTQEEKELDKTLFARSLLGIAESGWDFNPRFPSGNVRFALYKYASLDLNCLLYDAFAKASYLFKVINDEKLSNELLEKANNLKELIDKYLFNHKDGLYYDFNYVDNHHSPILSAASLYPYALGISKDIKGAQKVFDTLILQYGISTAPYRGETLYFQWDYPSMWPSNAYFAYAAMENVGDFQRSEEIKNKYLTTVSNVFIKTGKLWEKYNALTGEVSVTPEYVTPTMMGWTSGVYEYFYSK